jgi:8-oxo-dGTP pyrophosphatase MutT (NUDIX family)
MTLSPYVAGLRSLIGTDLLLLPAVTVIPRDERGRLLLVREVATGRWITIGGMVEVDEDPADAARREAEEEAGVIVELGSILAAQGGPQFRVQYPNGDCAAYVNIIYEATVLSGTLTPDGDETDAAAWFTIAELDAVNLSAFARAQLVELGWL